jgi:dTDP-D-glucose 4,6-dehydratase
MGWKEKIGLKEGISKVYEQYLNGKMWRRHDCRTAR